MLWQPDLFLQRSVKFNVHLDRLEAARRITEPLGSLAHARKLWPLFLRHCDNRSDPPLQDDAETEKCGGEMVELRHGLVLRRC